MKMIVAILPLGVFLLKKILNPQFMVIFSQKIGKHDCPTDSEP
jgi:Flp pilus assembly protein TadB